MPREVFSQWKKSYEKKGEKSRFYQLFRDIAQAEADAEAMIVRRFRKHTLDDPRSTERMLSRRFSRRAEDRWIETTAQEVIGDVTVGTDSIREQLLSKLSEIEQRNKEARPKRKKKTKKKTRGVKEQG